MRAWLIPALLLLVLLVTWLAWPAGDLAPLQHQALSVRNPSAPAPRAAIAAGGGTEQPLATDRQAVLQQPVDPGLPDPDTGDLQVLVVLPDGDPVARMPVEVAASNGRMVRATRQAVATSEQGEAALRGLPVGTVRVRVGLTTEVTGEVLESQVTTVKIVLPAAVGMTVSAIDAAGNPVAGADLLVWLPDRYFDAPRWRPGVLAGTTDARGQLQLTVVPEHHGNPAWVQARKVGLGASLARAVPGKDGQPNLVLTISRQQARATVLVTDRRGQAVGNAEVLLQPVDAPTSKLVGATRATPHVAESARTDFRGIARFPPLAEGRWQAAVRATGQGATQHGAAVTMFRVVDKRPVDVRVALGSPGRFRGIVQAKDGSPLASVEVSLRMLGQRLRATTGADGQFAFDGLACGSVDWTASCEGFGQQLGTTSVAPRKPGQSTDHDLTIVMQPLATLRGRLMDEDGRALVGWLLEFGSELPQWGSDRRRTQSEADGHFQVDLRTDLPYWLRVTEPAGSQPMRIPEYQEVFAQNTPLEVVVRSSWRPSCYLSMRLLDAAGTPALAPLLRCLRVHGAAPIPMIERIDATGRLRIGPLRPGACRLRLLRTDGFELYLPTIELAVAETRDLGDITWPAHGTLEVLVEKLPGIAPGDVLVEVSSKEGSHQVALKQRSLSAAFAVQPGPWRVLVFGDGFRSERVHATVIAGKRTTQRVLIRPAVRVPMRILKPAGEDALRGEILLPDGSQCLTSNSSRANHTMTGRRT